MTILASPRVSGKIAAGPQSPCHPGSQWISPRLLKCPILTQATIRPIITGLSLGRRVGEFMAEWKRAVVAILMAFAVMDGVYADMMPTSSLGAAFRPSRCVCDRTGPSTRLDGPAITDLDVSSASYPDKIRFHLESANETQESPHILASDQGSLDLCLYALLGLGMCRSGRWVRKSGLGHIPEWYHSDGPYQIGPSQAVGPDLLRLRPSLCLAQPDCTSGAALPQPGSVRIASLDRSTQCTPTTLPCRGPPARSY
jgi:hypothetical protein